MLQSRARELAPKCLFPPYQGRQKYMMSFMSKNVQLDAGFEDYEALITDLLTLSSLRNKEVQSHPVHATIDEKVVEAGMSQRRPGAHLDGCYIPDRCCEQFEGGECELFGRCQAWQHKDNLHPCGHPKVGKEWHRCAGWYHGGSGWRHSPFERMAVIVAATVAGCIVYEGDFEGEPTSYGDMEHIRPHLPEGRLLPANSAHLLSPDCIHESMVFNEPVKRQFLRIAFEV